MFKFTTEHVSGWHKSTYSSGNGSSQCVEAAVVNGWAAIRDSKSSCGPAHLFEPGAWAALLESLRAPKSRP
ncbi:DUF397 domain-containing protein [Embleya sp. NPDC059237]|uniref:DUF397 domain-containing protein n=1 Tax=Embleya sp. NPDC059237 TaxID=3346784 RepID=UPI0036C16F98